MMMMMMMIMGKKCVLNDGNRKLSFPPILFLPPSFFLFHYQFLCTKNYGPKIHIFVSYITVGDIYEEEIWFDEESV